MPDGCSQMNHEAVGGVRAAASSAGTTDAVVEAEESPTFFSELFLRMGRAAMQHPDTPILIASDADERRMHLHLYQLLHHTFDEWSKRQKRATALAARPDAVAGVIRTCAAHIDTAEAAASTCGLKQQLSGPPSTAEAFIRRAPSIALGSTSLCGDVPLPVTAQANVLELCRAVDQRLGLRTPIGAVHVLHFAAMSAALVPAAEVADACRLVGRCLGQLGTTSTTRAATTSTTRIPYFMAAAIFYEWALFDDCHAPALRRLSEEVVAYWHRIVKEQGEEPALGKLEEHIDHLLSHDELVMELQRGSADPAMTLELPPRAVLDVKGEEVGGAPDKNAASSYPDEEDDDDLSSLPEDDVDRQFWDRLANGSE